MKKISLSLPLSTQQIELLHAGDVVALSGTVYTARDAAHGRMTQSINNNSLLPIDLNNAAIYYCGPTPTREGEIIGSCGPTTSARMDDYTPLILQHGVKVMIGKGARSETVNRTIAQNKAVYFAAIGGAGALYQSKILACECVGYMDLGCEAIYKLTVKDMELVVATDSRGITFLK